MFRNTKNIAIFVLIGAFLILGMGLLVSKLQTIPAKYPAALPQTEIIDNPPTVVPTATPQSFTAPTPVGSAIPFLTPTPAPTATPRSTATPTTPGGSTTQIQYNNAGAFGGTANVTYNNSTNQTNFSDATDSTSITTGAVIGAGGFGITKSVFIGGSANVDTVVSRVTGGLGTAHDLTLDVPVKPIVGGGTNLLFFTANSPPSKWVFSGNIYGSGWAARIDTSNNWSQSFLVYNEISANGLNEHIKLINGLVSSTSIVDVSYSDRLTGGSYLFGINVQNLQISDNTGALNAVEIRNPTFTASSTTTYSTSATVKIDGAVAASTNLTITQPLALWVAGGISRFDGNIQMGGTSVKTSNQLSLTQLGSTGNTVPFYFGHALIHASSGYGRQTGKTAAQTLLTYTAGAADASYTVSANVNVTTSVTNSFSVTVAYTDETNTAQTLTLNFSTLAGAFVTTLTNILGVAPYEGVPVHIRAKASTAVTVATVGTFTSVTYNGEAVVTQVQ